VDEGDQGGGDLVRGVHEDAELRRHDPVITVDVEEGEGLLLEVISSSLSALAPIATGGWRATEISGVVDQLGVHENLRRRMGRHMAGEWVRKTLGNERLRW
jgi:hypothetical protein